MASAATIPSESSSTSNVGVPGVSTRVTITTYVSLTTLHPGNGSARNGMQKKIHPVSVFHAVQSLQLTQKRKVYQRIFIRCQNADFYPGGGNRRSTFARHQTGKVCKKNVGCSVNASKVCGNGGGRINQNLLFLFEGTKKAFSRLLRSLREIAL